MSVTDVDHRDLSRRWQAVLGRLQLEVAPHNWETWLKHTRALRWERGTLIAEARTAFNCDWLEQRLGPLIARLVEENFGAGTAVAFVPLGVVKPIEAATDEQTLGGVGTVTATARRHAAGDYLGTVNTVYTFDRYLPAKGNRIALTSCLNLVSAGDSPISPVVLYGAPGMGKTHLLHAVANKAASEGWSVACLSAEQFATRFLTALRAGDQSIAEFQETLRGMRLLVIDDLQYLAGREGTLRELVHTIDAVGHGGGHVLVASEVHPQEMGLPERLESRLTGGIVTLVEPFLVAEQRAFIEHLSREHRVSLPAWAVERMAGCELPSVRVLQGVVHAAIAMQRSGILDARRLDAGLVRVAITAVAPRCNADRELLDAIAEYFAVTFEDLVGRDRTEPIATARAVAVAALKERGRSFQAIATTLGDRDRGTVRESSARGRRLLDADPVLRSRIAG